jgi:protein FAM161A
MQEIEAAKLQKEVDEELSFVHPPFKAQPVPAHVHMPLYEKLQDEQRVRSEQVRQLTREYLTSIQKPFGFDSREKAKQLIRRHSYSGENSLRLDRQFKAKPLPNFYYQPHQENEEYENFEIFFFFVIFIILE